MIGWPAWLGYAFVIFAGSLTVLTEPVRVVLWLRRRRAARSAAAPAAAIPVPEPAGGPPLPPPSHEPTDERSDIDRRLFLNRVLAGGVLVAAAAITGVAARTAVAGPSWVRTATIRIRNLPAQAEGMRIALVSDLHLGSITGRDFCQQVVDLVNAQRPDLVCIAGDLTDGQADELLDAVQPITQLRAPDGVFFVTGNHEFYFDPDGWLAALPTMGLRVLANEGAQVRGMLVAGVHDIQGARIGRGPDMDAALAGRVDGQPVIMISHSPSLVSDAADRGVDLMVAGHTHGGQFIPGKWIVALTTPALSGWYEFGGHAALRVQRRGLLGTHRAPRRGPRHHDAHAAAGLTRAIDSAIDLPFSVLNRPAEDGKGQVDGQDQVFGKTCGRVTDPGPPVRFCIASSTVSHTSPNAASCSSDSGSKMTERTVSAWLGATSMRRSQPSSVSVAICPRRSPGDGLRCTQPASSSRATACDTRDCEDHTTRAS